MLKKIILTLGILVLSISMVGCQGQNKTVDKEVDLKEVISEEVENKEDSTDLQVQDIKIQEVKVDEVDSNGLKYLDVISEEQLEKVFPDKELKDYAKKFLGQSIPNFEIKNLDGEVIDIESLRGKDFVLEFMGTWCPACKSSAPHVEEFKRLNPDKEVLVVTFADTKEDILRYNKENGFTYPIHMSNISEDEFARLYELKYVPSFFFVDKDGTIQFIYVGDITTEFLSDMYDGSFGANE